jgi:hypothetical protein
LDVCGLAGWLGNHFLAFTSAFFFPFKEYLLDLVLEERK